MSARRLSAAWVYPVGAPPIPSGALLIDDHGRINAVGPDDAVATPPGVPEERFPEGVVMPGLVNAHTHLDLTGLAGEADDADFPSWIRRVRQLKEERDPGVFDAAAVAGVQRCLAEGITTVAETGDTGAVVRALTHCGARGIVYQEVFGPARGQWTDALAGLRERVAELARLASPRLRIGVSPHAPYTVSDRLYRAVAEYAAEASLPIAVHIAESVAESAFLGQGTGPFRDAWDRRSIPPPAPLGDSPIAWLDRHGVLQSGTLCIHAVQASATDVALMATRGCTVAHCPRSNRTHGHGDAPLRAFLDARLPVGVGTDSEISVAPTDLLAEARAAAGLAALDAAEALELATVGAARALGWSEEIGTLAPGKWADVVVRRLGPSPVDDVAAAVLDSDRATVQLTLVGGQERYRSP